MALDFPGLFQPDTTLQTADYRTAGSHQNESLAFVALAAPAATWNVIKTVPADKTYYVTAIILASDAAAPFVDMGTGVPASEVTLMKVGLVNNVTLAMNFNAPIKFAAGTIISFKTTHVNVWCNLVGWEE